MGFSFILELLGSKEGVNRVSAKRMSIKRNQDEAS